MIAISLFFHGNSILSPPNVINPLDWKLYFDKLLEQESISRFSLVGYSMGGRFALATLLLYPQLINHIYLVASDGLVNSLLFKIATNTRLMRFLFRYTINKYPTFIKILNTLTKIGLLNKGLLKFALLYMKHKVERERIFNSWIHFRRLKLHPKQLAKTSKEYQIPVYIILGTYDRIIPIKRIKPYLIKNQFLTYKTVDITHDKLFYYNFLNPT